MAEELLSCDGTDPVHIPDWDNVVGDASLYDGGYVGDLLNLTRSHIEEAKAKGELTEEDAGKAYSTAIIESVKEAVKFEIQEGKSKLEMCLLQAQADKIRADIINDDCLAQAECALKAAQTLKVQEETILVSEKINSEIKHNEDDGIYDQQVYKMIKDVEIAEQELLIAKSKENREYTNMIAEIDKVMGYSYNLDPDGYIDKATLVDSEDGKLDAEVENIEASTLKIIEETSLVTEKIESEDKHNEADGIYDQQIYKMIEDVEIAKTQVALDQANSIAQIDKVMGYEYDLDDDGNIFITGNAGDGKMDAEVEKIFAEKDLVIEQDNEIPLESARRDCTTASECKVNDQQIEKLICDCTNDTNMTDSKISLNAAQENKLACECCNDSKRTEGQIVKWECDCANSTNLTGAQADLYERQKEGFNDNANQKIYDTQMNAWSMVFADAELDDITTSITEDSVTYSYNRIKNRLDAAAAIAAQEEIEQA